MLEHTELIRGKQVLELAAGLGLPSIVAARFAKNVVTSDYDAGAVEMLRYSISLNKLENVQAAAIDWNDLPDTLKPELVILSDVNYSPADFEKLEEVIRQLASNVCTIVLCTPHRYSAISFVERIFPLVVHREERTVLYRGHSTPVTVFILNQDRSLI